MKKRPFNPEGDAGILWMLGQLCTVARFTESYPANATEPVLVWTKQENVPCDVQPTREPVRPRYEVSGPGKELAASLIVFLDINVDVEEGDLIRVDSGPYEGYHVEVTFRASYPGSHHELDTVLQHDYTTNDLLGSLP